MRWATRAGIHIDRAGCAWLIRRFVDPDAEFVFVTDPDQVPADATPFDMRGVELSHHHGDCTFETILRRFQLTDPVLWRIAEIVHEADLDRHPAAGDQRRGWEALTRREQEKAVRERRVFARMSPENKVQIVQTLERTGQVCAMVGDGANDAAAIRAATIGIGVVAHGSDPARTAADVMLLDGRIGSLLDALDEGRQLWLRVQAAVAILLGGNAGEVAFSIAGTALTGRSPLNTRQLLVVNLMTDALPAAALAVSPSNTPTDGGGRGPDHPAIWRTVAIRSATTAAAATAAWLMAGFTIRPRHASTVALVALVSTQLGQTVIDSHSPLVVTTAVGSLVLLGVLISIPGVSQLLGCTPLGPVGWSQALGTAAVATATAAVAPGC